jgi:hypothetical protein
MAAKPIVAGTDHCGDALTFAFEEASLRQASLTAVHSWHAPQVEQLSGFGWGHHAAPPGAVSTNP